MIVCRIMESLLHYSDIVHSHVMLSYNPTLADKILPDVFFDTQEKNL